MSKLSIMQLPKDVDFLGCLKAEPGHSIIGLDIAALEPHVLTEFSQDPRMLSLYGPGAKPNDIYPFFGAYTSIFGPKIRQHYDPEAPTVEGIKAVKKHCGIERDILKIAVLGFSYGMGAKKLQEDLALKGFSVSLYEAQAIFDDYWKFFRGVKRFQTKLLEQYQENQGYIINGRGRPIAVDNKYSRDILNRFVQSTGHDILMHYILLINRRRIADKVFMRPFCVDEHDATYWQVRNDHVEQARTIFIECLAELNKVLGWGVKFKGDVKVGTSFAVKCDE